MQVISQIRASAVVDTKTAKKLEVGSKFLTSSRAKKDGGGGTSSDTEPQGAPSSAGAPSSRSNRVAPSAAPAPSFSDELKALTASAKAERAAD